LLTNAAVLGSVWYNRSGTPDSTLTLTERELGSSYSYWQGGENSGLDLNLSWRMEQPRPLGNAPASVYFGAEGDWLDAAKLTELGIKVHERSPSTGTGAAFSSSLPADVLLVLEMDGAAYRRTLERVGRLYGEQRKPFTAVIMFGRRLEPWLASLSPGAGQSN